MTERGKRQSIWRTFCFLRRFPDAASEPPLEEVESESESLEEDEDSDEDDEGEASLRCRRRLLAFDLFLPLRESRLRRFAEPCDSE